ncbi:MAG: transposase [Treponema sp.]|nr:transposase [Treponema sp.]
MSARLVNVDRDTPLLFPEDLRHWLPENHLVHFIIDAVEQMNITGFKVNTSGSGSEQYPPEMMLMLLLYCYATRRMSSRMIEDATYTDVAVRYICGNSAHPDHTVICRFRTENRGAFKEAFTKVLVMAQEMGYMKQVGNISVDGTKIHANASKHSAVSYQRAKEMIEEAEKEVEELLAKAEDADSRPLEDGLRIPEEIRLREERKAALEEAKAAMEERYEEVKKVEQAEYERKVKERTEREKETGKKAGGKEPQPPAEEVPEKSQYNFTDPESRIMKAGNGQHFEQSYNAQAAVDVGSMLIVGEYVTNHANDKQELEEIVGRVDEVYTPETVSADTGFFSEDAVKKVERRDEQGAAAGPVVYCAVEKQSHHRSVADLEKQEEPPEPAAGATVKEVMGQRLKSAEGKGIYKKRKETVEPVFGIIKQAMGFRQFLLRGLEKVNLEWEIVCLGYNVKRLFRLSQG